MYIFYNSYSDQSICGAMLYESASLNCRLLAVRHFLTVKYYAALFELFPIVQIYALYVRVPEAPDSLTPPYLRPHSATWLQSISSESLLVTKFSSIIIGYGRLKVMVIETCCKITFKSKMSIPYIWAIRIC